MGFYGVSHFLLRKSHNLFAIDPRGITLCDNEITNPTSTTMKATTMKATDTEPKLLTVRETAVFLRIPLPTVYYLLQNGKLAGCLIGGRWRICRSTLEEMIIPKLYTKADDGSLVAQADDGSLVALAD